MSLSLPFLEFFNSDFSDHSPINVYFVEAGNIGVRGWDGKEGSFDIYLDVSFLPRCEHLNGSCMGEGSHMDESEVKSVFRKCSI